MVNERKAEKFWRSPSLSFCLYYIKNFPPCQRDSARLGFFRERVIEVGLMARVSAYSRLLVTTAHYFPLLPSTGLNWKPPCVVGIPSRTYVKKKKKKKLENKKKKSWRWGFSVLASTGEYSGVLGSFGEYLIKSAWGGCTGVGGGYVAPRPGCAFHGGKKPRYDDIFPGKYPFRPPARKIPPAPPCCFLPPSPSGLTSLGQNKSPGRILRGSDFRSLTKYPNLPVLSPAQTSVAICPEW